MAKRRTSRSKKSYSSSSRSRSGSSYRSRAPKRRVRRGSGSTRAVRVVIQMVHPTGNPASNTLGKETMVPVRARF